MPEACRPADTGNVPAPAEPAGFFMTAPSHGLDVTVDFLYTSQKHSLQMRLQPEKQTRIKNGGFMKGVIS